MTTDDTGRSCPLYPVGRSDAKLRFAGVTRGKKVVCTGPEPCPPDSESPEYHQVIQVRRKPRSVPLTSACAVFDYFRSLRYRASEAVYAIGLNQRNTVTVISKVSDGGLASAPIDTRTVFGPLLAAGSARFMMVHNHPSGDLKESIDDVAITRRFKDAGDLLGLALVDHVIIGENPVNGEAGFTSLRYKGLIP